jgi:hypothetical protein
MDSLGADLYSGLDQIYSYAVMNCGKLQELKYKNIYLQIFILANALNFWMHVHIIVSSSYKNTHNYLRLKILPVI